MVGLFLFACALVLLYEERAGQAVAETPGILGSTRASQNAATALASSVDNVLKRIREIDSPAIILQRTPTQIGFLSPIQLAESPIIDLVPRAIWRDKPILADGYQFSQQYYELPPSLYTSSAITPVGDLYRHGGWIPVVIGMALLGCGVRLIDDVADVRANPHAIFIVLLLFPALVKGEDGWATLLAGIPAIVLTWYFAVLITFRRRQAHD